MAGSTLLCGSLVGFVVWMLRISWTEKKVTTKAGVQRTLMKRIRQRQLAFLRHDLRKHGLENLVVIGRIEGRRARERQRLTCLDSLCESWKDNVSPTQLLSASENRMMARDGRHRRQRSHGTITTTATTTRTTTRMCVMTAVTAVETCCELHELH